MESDDEISIVLEGGGKTGSLEASSWEAGSVAGKSRVQGDGLSEAVMAFKSKTAPAEDMEQITYSLKDQITLSLFDKLLEEPCEEQYRDWSIYKVPNRLRKLNEASYTPKLVSIGPLHHGQRHLNSMERYKLIYCKNFLTIINMDAYKLIDHAMEWEDNVHEHYQDTVELRGKDFVEMFVLDGVFIIMLFLKERFPQLADNDFIFANQWMLRELKHDMMLLENQLPSFVLQNLLDLFYQGLRENLSNQGSREDLFNQVLRENVTFSKLTQHYFQFVGHVHRVQTNEAEEPPKRRHLVEYLQAFHLMSFNKKVAQSARKFEYPRSATELYAAGIKFRRSRNPCILKIRFFPDGVLRIPQLKVNEWTETLFRNLIAFEQCDHQPEYISSYIIFLDSLINTPMDVDLLVKCKIIENSLLDSEQVSNLFNNLYKETFTEYSIFYYKDICRKLNAYNKDYWHRWRAARYRWNVILKRDYFSNPWSGISVIAAIILLILTVVQTVCSILGL